MSQSDAMSLEAPAPIGGYRQFVQVSAGSRLLFVSGQIGETAGGDVAAYGYEQCRLAWTNVLHQLSAAGYAADHLIKATVFLTSAALVAPHQRARNEVLGARQPALSVVIVPALADPRWCVEVEVVAARDEAP
ncbi:RidA family protein [Dyella sp.]|jgi:enamine deaminase RidA (YjgF/YER057c/UK114 family)|uniref:RidA family protein n=1 Tax=Dyella sp. TaxID=1869338 RepID=UPI002D76D79A|nr:RidA family protein [Dyella sp.]HET6432826.1 RidA family protein [Dyella sp.]